MALDLNLRNIVLVGLFDPAAFDKYSFIKNSILKEEEILPDSFLGNPGGVQLSTGKYQLLITFNQIVLNAKDPGDNTRIHELFSKIMNFEGIRNLVAMGINFNWHLTDDSKNIHELSKDLFYNDKVKIFGTYFGNSDARFGAYASANYKDSRLKLDIKPANIRLIDGKIVNIDIINIQFNFHFDIKKGEGKAEILKWLSEYEAYQNYSKEISSNYQ